jgi:hypothetical protein
LSAKTIDFIATSDSHSQVIVRGRGSLPRVLLAVVLRYPLDRAADLLRDVDLVEVAAAVGVHPLLDDVFELVGRGALLE